MSNMSQFFTAYDFSFPTAGFAVCPNLTTYLLQGARLPRDQDLVGLFRPHGWDFTSTMHAADCG